MSNGGGPAEPLVVAIDGPSGAGKSTVARGVADRLGLAVLDTGAMYRTVTFAALRAGHDLDDGSALGRLAAEADIALGDGVVRLDGHDVTGAIRGPEVSDAVSVVSAHPDVRSVLVARQRAWVDERGGGVVEGRDIGTVVFPDATLKVYVTASEEERARRRQRDEHDAARPTDVDAVRAALARRDAHDAGRATSPLAAASDAVEIDTTGVSVADAVVAVVTLVESAKERA